MEPFAQENLPFVALLLFFPMLLIYLRLPRLSCLGVVRHNRSWSRKSLSFVEPCRAFAASVIEPLFMQFVSTYRLIFKGKTVATWCIYARFASISFSSFEHVLILYLFADCNCPCFRISYLFSFHILPDSHRSIPKTPTQGLALDSCWRS